MSAPTSANNKPNPKRKNVEKLNDSPFKSNERPTKNKTPRPILKNSQQKRAVP